MTDPRDERLNRDFKALAALIGSEFDFIYDAFKARAEPAWRDRVLKAQRPCRILLRWWRKHG